MASDYPDDTVDLGYALTVSTDDMWDAGLNIVECALHVSDPPVVFGEGGLREVLQMIGIKDSPPPPDFKKEQQAKMRDKAKQKKIDKELEGQKAFEQAPGTDPYRPPVRYR